MNEQDSQMLVAGQVRTSSWLRAFFPATVASETWRRLASRGLLSVVDQAIFSATSFFTAVIVARALTPTGLGQYYVLLSVLLIMLGVQEQLVGAPYLVYSKRRHGRALAEYAGSFWAQHLCVTALAEAGLAVAILGLWIIGPNDSVRSLPALLLALPMSLFRQAVRQFTFASLEIRCALLLDSGIAVLQLSALALLSARGWLSLPTVFAVIGLACGAACAGWMPLNTHPVLFAPRRFLPDWRHNWRFGKWALQTYVLSNTSVQIMLWLLSAMAGPAATGVFGACNNLLGICYVLLCGVCNVLTPQASHEFHTGGIAKLRQILLLTGVLFAFVLGGLCLFVLFMGDWAIVVAFGTRFSGTGAILIALTFSTAMNGVNMLAGNGLWAMNQPRANFRADVCCFSVTLVTAALLIHPLGAFGAALATLSGTSAAAILRTVTLLRRLRPTNCPPSPNSSTILPAWTAECT
jgi:O-antigen/teichoic acid export membrane protein